jgi:hypothetical protein
LAEQDPRANIWDDTDVQARLAALGIQTPQSTEAEPADSTQDTAPDDEDYYALPDADGDRPQGVAEDFGTTAAVLGGAALGAKLGKTVGIYRDAKQKEKAGLAKPRTGMERLKGSWKGLSHPQYDDDGEVHKINHKYQFEEGDFGDFDEPDADYKDEIASLENQIRHTTDSYARSALVKQLSNLKDRYGVAESLDDYRKQVSSQGFADSPVERTSARQRANQRHQEYLDKLHADRIDAPARASITRTGPDAHDDDKEFNRMRQLASDEDWTNTYDMMRDRINRHQSSTQRDVDPEQLKKITDIKYTPIREDEVAGIDPDAQCRTCGTAYKDHFRFDPNGKILSSLIRHPTMKDDFPGMDGMSMGKSTRPSLQQAAMAKPTPTLKAGGVDAKGRTQQQWIQAVKAKFPDARIMQSKMIDGPCQAVLSDGRKLSWNKVEQTVAENTELTTMLKYAGVPLKESVLTDSTGHTFDHIVQRFRREIADFEAGAELDNDLFDALYDYYFDDMPYGVKKARTGDPYEWVSERLADQLGITESNSGMIMPEADPIATVEAMPDLSAPVMKCSCNMTTEGDYCPEHGLAECSIYEMGTVAGGMAPVIGKAPQDPINYNAAITGAYYESKSDTALLARIKSLALLK